ncbi:MAG TPA: M14 family metallopeptidase [Methylocystis sp.]|nr:M14 family metallopeptidase [Methylocystis sp.]
MIGADSFSSSYSEAREKFLEAVAAVGGSPESFKHPGSGPGGEELATDAAWFGPSDASRVLVLISGVHGVEGYCGSGAQVDWLRREEFKALPTDTSVLMIHAVNPYGFAWTRRTNEDNVDLNRNWVDFSKPLPQNPGYLELAESLCPTEWSSEAQERSTRELDEWQASRGAQGWSDFRQAVTQGQYTHPLGLFFGGDGPSWSRRTQTAIYQKYFARAKRVGVIDYHTGLGPYGYAERLTLFPPEDPRFKRAATWFGAAVTSTKSGTSASKDISGDNITGSAAQLPHAEFTGIGFEVGTAPTPQVLQALRADAWLHAYGDPQSELGRQIKAQMRAAFYCETDYWKGMVAGQSLIACRQALAGLSLQADV